jgi:hypothetical protein
VFFTFLPPLLLFCKWLLLATDESVVVLPAGVFLVASVSAAVPELAWLVLSSADVAVFDDFGLEFEVLVVVV